MFIILHLLLLAAFAAFAARRILVYLHLYQQEEYDNARFWRWLQDNNGFDRKATGLLLITGTLELLMQGQWAGLYGAPLIATGGLLYYANKEHNPLKDAKKKLALTARAKRILGIAGGLLAVLALVLVLVGLPVFFWVLPVHAIPLSLMAANLILQPYENRVQQGFWDEAHAKLLRLAPTVVGITGSYGKTSVKHILGHVLGAQGTTLITPGSVNTPMGITRIIRERLTAAHRYFVAEMGAYGPGSIERLCRLAPPEIAVVTAVGAAHYERFQSLDTVAAAKFELVDAVLAKPNGFAIIASQVLDFASAREKVESARERFIVVGEGDGADLTIHEVRQTPAGTETDITWKDERFTLKTPLYGAHHGGNMALAFAAAVAMGMSAEDIVLAMATTPQVPHRLEVKRQPNGSVLIDDAYNSNPVGFASGLAALDLLRSEGGRRILVTPGMVELGDVHDEEHEKVGAIAGQHVDILLPVIPERIDAFVEAYETANPDGQVVPCANFAEASAWMANEVKAGDAVLLENDLPDLYESKLVF
ncbi:MAG: UDP-N-acetylmuramoyl-tripeptide--D-alanyl-D-alanine ligase [Alphaproteobacteria bacterium]